MTGPTIPEPDSCDRCQAADGRRIYVGQTGNGHAWDGLCDNCLTELAATGAGMLEPHACDECGELYDEAGGDGYAGLCPACADEDDEDDEDDEEEAEGWTCFIPVCTYRTPGMTLADRDSYNAHMREHERQLIAGRERAARALAKQVAGR